MRNDCVFFEHILFLLAYFLLTKIIIENDDILFQDHMKIEDKDILKLLLCPDFGNRGDFLLQFFHIIKDPNNCHPEEFINHL